MQPPAVSTKGDDLDDLDDGFVDAPPITDAELKGLSSCSASTPRPDQSRASSPPPSPPIDPVRVECSSVNQAGFFGSWRKESSVKHASRLADGLFRLDRAVKRLNQAGEAERFDCLHRVKKACLAVLNHHLNTNPITLAFRSSGMLNRKRARRAHVERLLGDVERELVGCNTVGASSLEPKV